MTQLTDEQAEALSAYSSTQDITDSEAIRQLIDVGLRAIALMKPPKATTKRKPKSE